MAPRSWWLALSIVLGPVVATARADDKASDVILAIHGGAGVLSPEQLTPQVEQEYRACAPAGDRCWASCSDRQDGNSLGAVVAAIEVMEDSPLFNAGKGAAFNHAGQIELDAAIMDGRTRKAGAVAAVRTIKNPIAAARAVMEKSKHVLLVGQGADAFAREQGLEIVDPSYFRTEDRWQMLQEELRKEKAAGAKPAPADRSGSPGDEPAGGRAAMVRFGTVGCVALDRHGDLAAGTSTGGLTGKLPGRVGDSPQIGAGTFADNASCAVSATGDGEYFIRAVACARHRRAGRIQGLDNRRGVAPRDPRQDQASRRRGGRDRAGPRGQSALTYSSEGMYRAYLTRGGDIHVLIFGK